MIYLYVKQIVEDFDKWYDVFASHSEAQKQVGLSDIQIMRDFVEPNIVTCLFKVDDLEKARAFTNEAETEAAQAEAGLMEKPVIRFLEEI